MQQVGERFLFYGTVQGVGFRPQACRLAKEIGLTGRVWNSGEATVVELWGRDEQKERFVMALKETLPDSAEIEYIERTPLFGPVPEEFAISNSQDYLRSSVLAPDIATCSDCLRELFAPTNRRHLYPFITCATCGPRHAICCDLPFDRQRTTMAEFTLCAECATEYGNPDDRRFHAQTISCPACGPKIWLEKGEGRAEGVLSQVVTALRAEKIVAIKGVAGFHLATLASSPGAIETLRQRKQRPTKPLALMAPSIEQIRRFARVNDTEERLLLSAAAPILLLDQMEGSFLPENIAPNLRRVGVMLPATGLHHLLLALVGEPLVMTSANISGAPICATNGEARRTLASIADLLLLHDREIVQRGDDSVVQVVGNRVQTIRRGRGFAPKPLQLPEGFGTEAKVEALGSSLKNSFALIQQGRAVVTEYLGDVSCCFQTQEQTQKHYRQLFKSESRDMACDLHPEMVAAATVEAALLGATTHPVQHHHAHVAAVLAEHGVPLFSKPVLGVVFDGFGYGQNGAAWGGEFLLCSYTQAQRVASLEPFPLLGGDLAAKEPWRNWLALEFAARGGQTIPDDLANQLQERGISHKRAAALWAIAATQPKTTSVGRLFDGVASMLGVATLKSSFEGEAAMQLEAAATGGQQAPFWHRGVEWDERFLPVRPIVRQIREGLSQGVDRGQLAWLFHQMLAQATVAKAVRLARAEQINQVVLAGGVFQNRLLNQQVTATLEEAGLKVLQAESYPANDGAISLGQAVVVAARLSAKKGGAELRPSQLSGEDRLQIAT